MLREKYYIELAKEKLSDIESKWDHDQVEPIEIYVSEKNKLEEISKKDVKKYKQIMEEIDKKYAIHLKIYLEQMTICQENKNRIHSLLEDKCALEKFINSLNKEIINLKLIKNMSVIKGGDSYGLTKNFIATSRFNYGFNKPDNNKKKIIQKEIDNSKKKLMVIVDEIVKTNNYNFTQVLFNF